MSYAISAVSMGMSASEWIYPDRFQKTLSQSGSEVFQIKAVQSKIVETAKLNDLNPYYYLEHLLTELPKLADDEGNIDTTALDPILPWAEGLPKECYKPRR